MDTNLLIPGLITMIDYNHGIERVARSLGHEMKRSEGFVDYYVKAWGGVPGLTPRRDPALAQREVAVLPWMQALEVFRTKTIQNLRGG